MRYLIAVLALWALPAAAMGPSQRECQLDVPCKIGARSYHVKEPDGWDGTSPLPVLIHFHGWQRTGALPVQHQRGNIGVKGRKLSPTFMAVVYHQPQQRQRLLRISLQLYNTHGLFRFYKYNA